MRYDMQSGIPLTRRPVPLFYESQSWFRCPLLSLRIVTRSCFRARDDFITFFLPIIVLFLSSRRSKHLFGHYGGSRSSVEYGDTGKRSALHYTPLTCVYTLPVTKYVGFTI